MLFKAYAKINLTLDIVRKMDNGYHELDSVMRTVSMCDKIEITESGENSFSVSGSFAPTDGTNLCIKARDAFFKYTGIPKCVSMSLYKFIPSGAGLGGGSADAAAVLNGLNAVFHTSLSDDELRTIGASLGADVPFCIKGGTARCRGIGDIIEPVVGIKRMNLVIAKGDSGLSTPAVYGMLDSKCTLPTGNYTEMLVNDVENALKYASNGFEGICKKACPDIERLMDFNIKNGAISAHMSGSGSAVYGVYRNGRESAAAATKLRKMGYFAADCITL